jgi:hypothetical protein
VFGYLSATRHPWACLLFLLPLLVAYEGGVLWLGGDQAQSLRNGADAWLRWGLEVFGFRQFLAAPIGVLVLFAAWSWARWRDRPDHTPTVFLGMLFESGLFALLLWGFSRNYGAILDRCGITLAQFEVRSAPLGQVITYVGAGIYEEVLFRLVLFAGLATVFRLALLPGAAAMLLAALGSAVLFAAAHHVGPYGEPMEPAVFLFRGLAGLYFTAVFVFRGFGVAVGAHAGYDVLVGVAIG